MRPEHEIRPAKSEAEAAQAFKLALGIFGKLRPGQRYRREKVDLWWADPSYSFRNLILAFDPSGSVTGLVRLVPRVMHRGRQRIRAVALSSVCVRADQRGSGLSSLLIGQALAFAESRAADLAFLVARRAADHFYTRYGFWGVASYNRILLRRQDLGPAPRDLRFRPTVDADVPALLQARSACLREAFGASQRDERLWRFLLRRFAGPSPIRWYTLVRGRQAVGYALMDASVVYELAWNRGENAADALSSLARHVRSRTSELEIRAPSTHPLLGQPLLVDAAVVYRQCIYGGHMARILNAERLGELLAERVLRSIRRLKVRSYEEAGDGIVLQYRYGRCRVELQSSRGSAALGYRATCRLLGLDAPSARVFRLDQALPFNLGIADEV